MIGRPYTYSRGMAIAQLMHDMRRPVLKEIVAKNKEHYEMNDMFALQRVIG
jgi:hypothetical protein